MFLRQCSIALMKRQEQPIENEQRARVCGNETEPGNCGFSTKERTEFSHNPPKNSRSARLVTKKAS